MAAGPSSNRDVVYPKITYALLTELKNASAYAFAMANERILSGSMGVEEFVEIFIPHAATSGQTSVERNNSEAEKAFFALMPTTSSSRKDIITDAAGGSCKIPILPPISIPPLPRYAKYLILAAYCASYNSPRSDLRLFGRGPFGKTRGGGGGGAED